MQIIKLINAVILFVMGITTSAMSNTLVIDVYATDAQPSNALTIGTVVAEDTPYGLLLTPKLTHLPPGLHGFHIHEHPDCGDHGNHAEGHYDPNNTGKHLGPYNDGGHLGDLPPLYVDNQGDASLPILAPRLTVDNLMGHALMIHAGGDNFSDHPEPLGGGGARIACGVIP